MKFSLNSKTLLISVLAIALVARLAFLLIFGNSIFFYEKTGRIHGSTAYDDYALNLLETGVYGREAGVPDSTIAPAYSYVVAAMYSVFGRGGLQIGLLHSLLDLIMIACVFDISRRLFQQGELWGQSFGLWIGTLAALFTALYPYLIFQNLTLNDTAFFMTQMHLFIWLMIRLREEEAYRKSLVWAVLAGLILGLATLTRALLPLFAILTAIWFLFRLNLLQTILRLAPVAIISFLVLLPWMIRSYGIYHSFVAVALNTGENFWQGNNEMTIPLFEAGYDVQWSPPPQEADNLDEQAKQAFLMQTALDYLSENPQDIPRLLWVKFLVHWNIDVTPRTNPPENQEFNLDENGNLLIIANEDANMQDIGTIATYESDLFDKVARPVHFLYYGGLFLLALVGIALSAKQWREVSLLWFLQISMMIMYLIFHPSTRYRVPTDPLLFAFSAFALVWLVHQWWKRRTLPDARMGKETKT